MANSFISRNWRPNNELSFIEDLGTRSLFMVWIESYASHPPGERMMVIPNLIKEIRPERVLNILVPPAPSQLGALRSSSTPTNSINLWWPGYGTTNALGPPRRERHDYASVLTTKLYVRTRQRETQGGHFQPPLSATWAWEGQAKKSTDKLRTTL